MQQPTQADEHSHGPQEHQWYENDPERLKEEKNLVREYYPQFQFSIDKQGCATWEGEIYLLEEAGYAPYSPMRVLVKCPNEYPKVVPVVMDIEKKLCGKSPHFESSGRICVENRCTDNKELYEGSMRIKDVIEHSEDVLKLYWASLQEGADIGGQPHGEYAFIKDELDHGCYPLDRPCLCGRTGNSYEDCCNPKVQLIIDSWTGCNRDKKQKGAERCLCGSGRTVRKCKMRRHCIRYCDPSHTQRSLFKRKLKEEIAKQRENDREKYYR